MATHAPSLPKKVAGTVISERGTQLAPAPSTFDLRPRHGSQYVAQDVLSLPKPVPLAQLPTPGLLPVLVNDLHTLEELARGPHLTAINHVEYARQNPRKLTKRRPKNAIRHNNSSYISRGIVSDQINRRMRVEELSECLLFTEHERSLQLLDFGAGSGKLDFLLKIVFAREWPLCHALNAYTASANQLDLVVGMSSGDLVWVDLVSQRYERVSKHFPVSSPVLALSFVPNNENVVAVAHQNGQLVLYDMFNDETARPTFSAGIGVTSLTFLNPTQILLTFETDYLKILDLEVGGVREYLPALFGGVFCAELSPDGKFWASGGESDIVSIYETCSRRLVVNLIGHKAWVRSIAWEERVVRDADLEGMEDAESSTIYRLVTLGDDQQVIVWDFALSLMTPPRHVKLHKPEDLAYVSQTHCVQNSPDLPVVHAQQLRVETAKLLPVAAAKPAIAEYGPLVLTSLKLTANSLIVATKDDTKLFTAMTSAKTSELDQFTILRDTLNGKEYTVKKMYRRLPIPKRI